MIFKYPIPFAWTLATVGSLGLHMAAAGVLGVGDRNASTTPAKVTPEHKKDRAPGTVWFSATNRSAPRVAMAPAPPPKITSRRHKRKGKVAVTRPLPTPAPPATTEKPTTEVVSPSPPHAESSGTVVAPTARTDASVLRSSAQGTRNTAAGPANTPAHRGQTSQAKNNWARNIGTMIARHAQRNYPRSARRKRQQGRVVLAIRIDRHGRIRHVHIKKSCGNRVLDQAALASITEVERVPPPPAFLTQEQHTLYMPVQYRIR